MRAAAKEKAKRARAKLRELPPTEGARQSERERAKRKKERGRLKQEIKRIESCETYNDLDHEREHSCMVLCFPVESKKAKAA